jgi:hypothetical protein
MVRIMLLYNEKLVINNVIITLKEIFNELGVYVTLIKVEN